MAKAPISGKVKTRMSPQLTDSQCAQLAECFLLDTMQRFSRSSIRRIIAHETPPENNYFTKFATEDFELIEQAQGNLGERIYAAFEFAFRNDSESVVMIGTDSPTFPEIALEKAFLELEAGVDAVLGRTLDGGFYLIGLRRLDSQIFENVEWSTSKTFDQTSANARKIGLSLAEIEEWYDIDDFASLQRLRDEFLRDKASRKIAPRSFKFLAEFFK